MRAVVGLDRPGDVRSGIELITHRVPVDAALLADPDTDLRKLACAARARPRAA